MQALVFEGPGSIGYTADLPDPTIDAPDQAIVSIDGAGLCGSDLHPYLGRERARSGVIPGHEGVGVVAEVGASVTRFRPGDRVIVPFTVSCGACDRCTASLTSRCLQSRLFGWGDPDDVNSPALPGLQAEAVTVPLADSTLVGVPESVSNQQAILLSDNLPTAWYAVRRSELATGDRLLILGSGAVGLCSLVIAFHRGASQVVVVDPIEHRRRVAAGLGARTLAPDDPILDELPPVTSVIDSAGTQSSQQLAARLAAPGATISMIAVQTEPRLGIDPATIYDRNLTVRSGRAPVRALLDGILPLVATGSLDVPDDLLFTDEGLPLSEGPAIYRRFAERSAGIVKAWFDPRR